MKPNQFLRSSLAKAITPWHYLSATALVALTVLGSQSAQAVMLDLGSLPNGPSGLGVAAISGNGQVVVGSVNRDPSLWSPATGDVTLPVDWSGYDRNSANSVNIDGRFVAGTAFFSLNNTASGRAYRWDVENGTSVQLGTLGGAYSQGFGISDDGQVVVGGADIAKGYFFNHAFRWENGVMSDLGTLRVDDLSVARGVSGDGQVVVGYSTNATLNSLNHAVEDLSTSKAFRWDTTTTTMVDLGTLGGASQAFATNQDGSVIVGHSAVAGHNHAVIWTAPNALIDLKTLGGDASSAADVNADGSVVVGSSQIAGGAYRAFRWTDASGMINLGVLTGQSDSYAIGVSDDGDTVVGRSGNRTFIWDPSSPALQDLSYLQTSIIRSAVTVSHLTASQNRRLRDLAQEQCQPGAAQTYCLSLGSQNYRGDADSSATQKNLNLSAGMRLNEQYSAGVTGSLGRADLKVQSAEQKKAFALGVWGAFQQNADDTGWGGAASVAVGQSENSFDRGMALTDVQRARAHLDLTGTALRVAGNFGLRMNTPLGDSLITPEVALSHVSTQQDGFTERSVAFPLTVKGSTEQRTYATFGVRSATQVSPKGTLNLALAVDTLLSDNTQGVEGHSKVPGLSRFNLDSSVDQRRVIPTATVGYSHALTANSALGGGVQVATSTHQDGAPLFGLGMQYRYSF